ncbi:jg25779 [Pararge aegeria aegeria]|uniref:Jg25779 protein n=1 Tax=Pararge aegeria aegeria TaxID=348720 RepID=A0A8S4QHJ4_9NEOP|nr:jg25779 [Pararge aegeria aegeria]
MCFNRERSTSLPTAVNTSYCVVKVPGSAHPHVYWLRKRFYEELPHFARCFHPNDTSVIIFPRGESLLSHLRGVYDEVVP